MARVKAHQYIEEMLQKLQKVPARPSPRDGEPYLQIGLLLDAVVMARKNLDRAAKDLAVGVRRGPRN